MTAEQPDLAALVETLRALDAAATPGPWIENVLGSEGYDVRAAGQAREGSRILRRPRVALCGYEAWEVDKANATLIAAMRNALPALLNAAEEAAQWKGNATEAGDELARISRDYVHLSARHIDLEAEAAALRARITALADEWEAAVAAPPPPRGKSETVADVGVRTGVWFATSKAASELRALLGPGGE